MGYFAAIYLGMTTEMRRRIQSGAVTKGVFQRRWADPARMEDFDIMFASRYIDALRSWHRGGPCSESWRLAFDAASSADLSILQHVSIGVNAHMRLDLAVAAAQVRPAANLHELAPDFFEVNGVLRHLIPRYRTAVERLSPDIHVLFTGRHMASEDQILTWLARMWRRQAWYEANKFVHLGISPTAIKSLDTAVAGLAHFVLNPAKWFDQRCRTIVTREPRNVPSNIRELRAACP